ncbi:hypothetical protein CBR_g19443 [Chara braunii]|uniref:Light-mediated development protein DET1 n=1 Tax=Chara braunii TaxID=69332 RepID=A0A388KXY9_CHABU|nr:hypothetical protein CBR_g19443 [Chara braunii]|eukprot:GBG74929.1 hypothetical protein CBR_g19443 [Chara braunii]
MSARERHRQNENLFHRLRLREVERAKPGAAYNRCRLLYENVVPNHTIYDVECSDHSIRRFTNDGQFLICFSRQLQDLIVYRYRGVNHSWKGEEAPEVVGGGGSGAARRGGAVGVGAGWEEEGASLSSPPAGTRSRAFDNFFHHLYTVPLGSGTEILCKDFCLFTDSDTYGVLATSSPPDNNPPYAHGAVAGVPAMESITFHLVKICNGEVMDRRRFDDDYIHLAHNAGVFLYEDLLAILSVRFQSIHILQIRETGLFVNVRTIGNYCREDDELVLKSHAEDEARFRRGCQSLGKSGLPRKSDEYEEEEGMEIEDEGHEMCGKAMEEGGDGGNGACRRVGCVGGGGDFGSRCASRWRVGEEGDRGDTHVDRVFRGGQWSFGNATAGGGGEGMDAGGAGGVWGGTGGGLVAGRPEERGGVRGGSVAAAASTGGGQYVDSAADVRLGDGTTREGGLDVVRQLGHSSRHVAGPSGLGDRLGRLEGGVGRGDGLAGAARDREVIGASRGVGALSWSSNSDTVELRSTVGSGDREYGGEGREGPASRTSGGRGAGGSGESSRVRGGADRSRGGSNTDGTGEGGATAVSSGTGSGGKVEYIVSSRVPARLITAAQLGLDPPTSPSKTETEDISLDRGIVGGGGGGGGGGGAEGGEGGEGGGGGGKGTAAGAIGGSAWRSTSTEGAATGGGPPSAGLPSGGVSIRAGGGAFSALTSPEVAPRVGGRQQERIERDEARPLMRPASHSPSLLYYSYAANAEAQRDAEDAVGRGVGGVGVGTGGTTSRRDATAGVGIGIAAPSVSGAQQRGGFVSTAALDTRPDTVPPTDRSGVAGGGAGGGGGIATGSGTGAAGRSGAVFGPVMGGNEGPNFAAAGAAAGGEHVVVTPPPRWARHGERGGPGLGASARPMLGGIKQRLLAFMFRSLYDDNGSQVVSRAQRIKRFHFNFQQFIDLVMWKVQFLDRCHLLIKFGSADGVVGRNADGVVLRNTDGSHQNAFLAVYDVERTEIVAFYQNSSEELLRLYERFNDHFKVPSKEKTVMRFISSYENSQYVREQHKKQKTACRLGGAASATGRGGSYMQVVRRALASLPFNCQCESPCAYFDQGLFSFDEKLISATDRHKPCMDYPIKFISRRRPNSLPKFKIFPGIEHGSSAYDIRAKRVASYVFHPYLPFAISIQQSYLQPPIVNFHFRR